MTPRNGGTDMLTRRTAGARADAAAALRGALGALALRTLDPDAWVRVATEASGGGPLSPTTTRTVRRLVETARAMVSGCPPCVVCSSARAALVQRVAANVTAARLLGRTVDRLTQSEPTRPEPPRAA